MNTNTRMYRLKGSELFVFATTIEKAKAKFKTHNLSGTVYWVRQLKKVKPWQKANTIPTI